MLGTPHATHKLMDSMREMVAQSERVARAEARVVASRVGDVAEASARRMVLYGAAALLSTLAVAFLLVAAYDALCTWVPGWQAALIVAAATSLLAALCAGIASKSPSISGALLPAEFDEEDRR